MMQLLQALSASSVITSKEFQALLVQQITAEERELLEKRTGSLIISEYNRNTLLRMLDRQVDSDDMVDKDRMIRLIRTLQNYLQTYMENQPEGHRWIILACLFLSGVVKEPMHPQAIVHWKQDSSGMKYYCPAFSAEEGSACRFCVCLSVSQDGVIVNQN